MIRPLARLASLGLAAVGLLAACDSGSSSSTGPSANDTTKAKTTFNSKTDSLIAVASVAGTWTRHDASSNDTSLTNLTLSPDGTLQLTTIDSINLKAKSPESYSKSTGTWSLSGAVLNLNITTSQVSDKGVVWDNDTANPPGIMHWGYSASATNLALTIEGHTVDFTRVGVAPVVDIPVVISPESGTFASAQQVTIVGGPSGSVIYYTIDGTPPTTASTRYTGPFQVSSTAIVKAVAYSGSTPKTSGSASYVIQTALPTTAAPSFSPAAGAYTSSQSITLSSTTANAAIYYTTDGSTPNQFSTPYTGPVAVASTTTIKAIAIAAGGNSLASTATYTINTTNPPVGTGLVGTWYNSASAQDSGFAFSMSVTITLNANGTFAERDIFDVPAAAVHKDTTVTGTWQSTSTTLTLKSGVKEASTPYQLIGNTLTITDPKTGETADFKRQ